MNGKAVLDEAYNNGLKVIMVVDGFTANVDIAEAIATAYKDHPAILMWMIGNEFNYPTDSAKNGVRDTFMNTYDTFFEACAAADDVAEAIKAIDTNHRSRGADKSEIPE